ncbi:unnamed protein product [Vicia faba]|uniref:Uncharacterized protein n=1 Tax=Vicia faba TaxID=3906 RepID=A0AAV1A411_VICFA|nr:unnamed protein product [Vicia faba]
MVLLRPSQDEVLYLCGPESTVSASSTDSFYLKKYGIGVVTIQSDTANGMRERKDKLIMGCDRGENYKKKNEYAKSYDGNYTMKVRCPFRLRSVPSSIDRKVMVICEMHNHRLNKDLEGTYWTV